MRRFKTTAWIVGLAIAAPMLHEAMAAEPAAGVTVEDESVLYTLFLYRWTDHGASRIQVASKPSEPSPETLRRFAECAGGNDQWAPAKSTTGFAEGLAKLGYVHLTDPGTWHAKDPGELIAKGKSVDEAVQAGFDQGLLTLSALRYDPTHRRAAMTYAFVCGSLCGSGGTVLFEKTRNQWKESKRQCGGWVS